MRSYRLGIVGYGGFGQFLHHAWGDLPGVEVVAVFGRRRTPRLPPGIRYYDDWRALLDREGLDIVAVATPPATHAEIACHAMERGIHVLIEKPLATTLEDAERIVATARRTGVRATVDLMMRYNPILSALREITRGGLLGRLFRVDVENYAAGDSLPPEHWFWNWDLSGGILVEHGVHFFDLVRFLSGEEARRVSGALARTGGRVDRMAAQVLHGDGLIAAHFHAFTRPGFTEETRISLAYDLATVELSGWIPLEGRIRALVTAATLERLRALLPGFRVEGEAPVEALRDVSRPAGWGDEWPLPPSPGRRVRSGEREYRVEALVHGSFRLPGTKAEVYAGCLRALMEDFLRYVEDPSYVMRVTLDDGLECLRVALDATRDALRG
ncbi:MAG: Gfo/Idh/MocA family oxidoreductase [Caldiserica bacterium]|nr:Gfo/Idh/MocA family oxidoreductase [Caldisericota bacterium]